MQTVSILYSLPYQLSGVTGLLALTVYCERGNLTRGVAREGGISDVFNTGKLERGGTGSPPSYTKQKTVYQLSA